MTLAAASVFAAVTATWIDVATGPVTRPELLDWEVWASTVPGAALAIAGGVLAVRRPHHVSTAKPRAWPPRTTRARATRPRPPAKQTAQIPDAVVSHYARLLDDSGIMPPIDAELGPRPGPP
ncbi:hypothetical protein ACFYUK_45485 [Nonomuraea wenchangensis]